MKVVFPALRFLLAGLFLYAGLVKASASAQFALALVPFTIIPATWLGPIALILPLVEILGGLFLLLPSTKRIGAAVILALCIGFVTILAWALTQGIIVSCSCFGRDDAPSAYKMALTMARDVLLAAAALAIYFEDRLRPQTHTPGTSQKTPANA